MPRIIETPVYSYDELSDKAKAKARDWYREVHLSYDWWDDSTFDALKDAGSYLGFTVGNIYFDLYRGSCSFDGQWSAPYRPATKVRVEYPTWEALHARADMAREVCQSIPFEERGDTYQVRGSRCGAHEGVEELAKSFSKLCLKFLRDEWDYLNSDEEVTEAIRANDYTFTAEGKRFG